VSTPAVALLAAAATATAALPTVAALAAAGAGAPRLNGGPFGKTERCAALFVACLAGAELQDPTAALVAVAWAVIAGSVATAALRVRVAHGVLREVAG
jgi:CDP-diacylglycerol--glycerol-3-phosphate 3-phosphatidyltransferase